MCQVSERNAAARPKSPDQWDAFRASTLCKMDVQFHPPTPVDSPSYALPRGRSHVKYPEGINSVAYACSIPQCC